MAEFRKMTMGEVAEVAGLPKETLRARINRGVVEARKSPGWARFNLPSVVKICVHAEMMRRVGIEEVAIKAADFISESVHDFCKRPPYRIKRQGLIDGNYLFSGATITASGTCSGPTAWKTQCKSSEATHSTASILRLPDFTS